MKKYEKLVIFIFLTTLFFKINKILRKRRQLKICLCVVAKNENKYIEEFVVHYQNYNVDKIFIYDNNDINGEKMESKLSRYIDDNFVEILNFRGKNTRQRIIFQDCYTKNYQLFNWLLFYDIDEFIYLRNYKNIQDYLKQNQFKKCQSIYLNWLVYSDNNLIYYDNRTLFQRFNSSFINKTYVGWGKNILKGNLKNIKIISVHTLDRNITRCDGFGNICKEIEFPCNKPDFDYFFINHYKYKSTEEFITKINKGDCVFRTSNETDIKLMKIRYYIDDNKINLFKLAFIAKKSRINRGVIIRKFKNKLIKNNYIFKYINNLRL